MDDLGYKIADMPTIENVVNGFNSSGGLLDNISNIISSLLPIGLFLFVGVVLMTKRSFLMQIVGLVAILTGLMMGLLMFRSTRGF